MIRRDFSVEPAVAEPLSPLRAFNSASWTALGVRWIAAALLIFAAVLKAWDLITAHPFANPSSRLAILALIEFELLLGGLLLINAMPKLAWAIALLTFMIFAGVSGRQAMLGAPSCGCFGRASVSPRIIVAVDLAIVLLLLITGRRARRKLRSAPGATSDASHATSNLPRIARFIAIATITLLMFLPAVAVLVPRRGLVADHRGYDVGPFSPLSGRTFHHTFTLHNTSARPIRITGYTTTCSCSTADYPTDPIAPGASADIHVHANWSNVVLGDPQAQITLTTDHWLTRTVPLLIRAELARP
jgi:hypothetical protein